MPFASNLARWRKKRGYTPSDMANKIGLTTETYLRIEEGSEAPSTGALVRISDTLQVQLHELFANNEKTTSLEERYSIMKAQGRRIAFTRFTKEMTAEETAAKLGMPFKAYKDMECGEEYMYADPTIIPRLAALLGVTEDYIRLDNGQVEA